MLEKHTAGVTNKENHTPMRVYKEAIRKGDSDTMKRAMGYANECSDRAEE